MGVYVPLSVSSDTSLAGRGRGTLLLLPMWVPLTSCEGGLVVAE